MTTWPILSVVTFLPLVGALIVYISRGDDEAAQAQLALDRAVDHARHLRGLADPGLALRSRAVRTSSSSRRPRGSPTGITYHMGVDGISLPLDHPDHRDHAALHHRELAVGDGRGCANT